MELGGRSVSLGSKDPKSVNKPGDLLVSAKTNELYVADGYGTGAWWFSTPAPGHSNECGARLARSPRTMRHRADAALREDRPLG